MLQKPLKRIEIEEVGGKLMSIRESQKSTAEGGSSVSEMFSRASASSSEREVKCEASSYSSFHFAKIQKVEEPSQPSETPAK